MTCHNIFKNKKGFVSASCFVRKYAYCSFKLMRGDEETHYLQLHQIR